MITNKVHLLLYQKAWIDDKAPVAVYEKSRRIGITWTTALAGVLDAADPAAGSSTWYTGVNHDFALEFIEAAAMWTQRLNAAARETEEIIVEDEDKDILAYRIRFASGQKIVALSSRSSNLRGKRGNIVIDEAAFHDNLPALLKAALAIMMWGGRIRVISTHNGADNPFADLVNDIRAGRLSYSLHRTTLDDALAAGLYRAICRETGREWSKEAEQVWRQDLIEQYRDGAEEELFVIPSHGGGVFLPAELIESRMRDGIPVLKAKGGTAYQELEPSIDRQLRLLDSQLITCFGVDFGRSGDISAFWFFQIQQNLVRRTAFVIELREVPHEVQRAILFRALDGCPRLISGVMDAAGNGSWLAEVKGLKYGGTREQPGRIELLMLNLEWYRDQMPKLKRAFEEAMIELPRNDDVLADFRLIRMEKGVAKVPDVRIKDTAGRFRHGDSAIACALAYYASYRNQEVYEYTPVRPKRSSRDFLTRGGDDEESSRGLAAQLNAVFGWARFGRGTW